MTHEFDQSLEPADLLQFQSGSAGFKLDKKQVSSTWVTAASSFCM